MLFSITDQPIRTQTQKRDLESLEAGAYVEFEGRVRKHSHGREVQRLDYEAYHELAESEGRELLQETIGRFDVIDAAAVHRVGALDLGEVAVWIGVVGAHRADAFRACAFCIDEIKARLPIWKREVYANGEAEWINGCCGEGSVFASGEAVAHNHES
jgi:molybdopterin synthase catalytic subunit